MGCYICNRNMDIKNDDMTSQEAVNILKQLCDGALKMGLISKTEDAALLHEMFLLIKQRMIESAIPDPGNNKQLQPANNHPQVNGRPQETGLREPTHY